MNIRHHLLTLIPVLLLLFLVSLPAASWSVTEEWLQEYDNGTWPFQNWVLDSATDPAGNVYLTGEITPGGMVTMKYAPDGTRLWVAHYHPGVGERGWAMAVDDAGNVYVTGTTLPSSGGFPTSAITVKYDTDGILLWATHYDGPDGYEELASEIALDGDGNVIVGGYTGWESPEGMKLLVIKYDNDGNQLWVETYDGLGGQWAYDYVNGLAVDAAGNIYVTGESSSADNHTDYVTIKYDPDGTRLWAQRYDHPSGGYDIPMALALDGQANVYVTGISEWWRGVQYTTIKYDTHGNRLWVAAHNDPERVDYAYDLAVDEAGYAVVTGDSSTVRYAPDGTELWSIPGYNPPAGGDARGFEPWRGSSAVALDDAGDIYVTWGYRTFKYTPDGVMLWHALSPESGGPPTIALDGQGNFYVNSSAYDPATEHTSIYTVRYSQGGTGTLSGQVSCLPSSGTLPFDTTITVTAGADVPMGRRRAALRLDVELANGTTFGNWRTGTTTIDPGTPFTTSLVQTIPNDPGMVGTNRITLVMEDVTPAPLDQPPYLPAGDMVTDSCEVVGLGR